ncbi:hypothetical protein HDU76_011132, partial [Blyttiomyces sp. JEL0837]
MASVAAQVYDYLVIGGGSGGIASARRAAMYNAKVLVVENNRWGGTCVNVGCVPKKIMWNTASIAEMFHEAKGYGFDVTVKGFAWETLKVKRDAYIARLNTIYTNNLTREKVDYVQGTAKFVSADTIEVNGVHYKSNHILIATGSRAWIPNTPGGKEFEFLRSFDNIIRESIMTMYQQAGIKIVPCSFVDKIENKGTMEKKDLTLHVRPNGP